MLTRFELRGWVISGWEDPEPEDRPARRWYRLTELGKRELTALVRVPGYDIAHLEKLRSGGI
jgi:DNA-binding PadR family transcriptional regulator